MKFLLVRLKQLLLYVNISNNSCLLVRYYLSYLFIFKCCIIVSLFLDFFTADCYYLYCIDSTHDLSELKEELAYWQNDLQALQQIYKDKGYDILNPEQLSQQQLADKAFIEESIADGRKNVSKSIKDIGEFWKKENEPSSSLGKREGEQSQSQVNKKQH